MVPQTKIPPRASQCSPRGKLPPENNAQSGSILRFLDNVQKHMKNQSLFSPFSPHVELPSENSFLAIIRKLIESNSQLIGLLDAERPTSVELAMENARLKIELGNEKDANLRDHEARSCELPSVQFMQMVNGKNPRKQKMRMIQIRQSINKTLSDN